MPTDPDPAPHAQTLDKTQRRSHGYPAQGALGMAPGPAPPDWEATYLEAFARTYTETQNPERRAGMLEARHILIDIIRQEAVRRALEPSRKAILHNGVLLGYNLLYDNKHIEWLLERLAPEEFHLATRHEIVKQQSDIKVFRFAMGETDDNEIIEDAEIQELPAAPEDAQAG